MEPSQVGPGVSDDPAHVSIMQWNFAESSVAKNTLRRVPRIGKKYQAVVPSFNKPSDCKTQACNDNGDCFEDCQQVCKNVERDRAEYFAKGLPILVTGIHRLPQQTPVKPEPKDNSSLWVHGSVAINVNDLGAYNHETSFGKTDNAGELDADESDDFKHAESVCRKRRKRKGQGWTRVKRAHVQTPNLGKRQRKSLQDTSFVKKLGKNAAGSSEKIILVTDSPMADWSDDDMMAFIAGIYLLGKDFAAMKRFLGNKKILDIVVFYYGYFYGTEYYSRWAESRKGNNRKCIHGMRLLTGWRQQELSKRLLPDMNKMKQEEALKAVEDFNNSAISPEELVMRLKAATGLDILVRAIGLGAGKRDLTAVQIDPGCSSNQQALQYDIPVGRACSSLSNREIIAFLNGNIRISKARAEDLFWEAAWPRLLARGWHSEQIGDQGLSGPRGSLVFIIPGVPESTRSSLEKGVHYFDSISALLNLIAVNSSLLDPPSGFLALEERWEPEESIVG